MRRISWGPELALGDEEIDAQHARMVEIFNALQAAMEAGRVGLPEDLLLDELIRVADANFRSEERLMQQCGAKASFAWHAETHRILLYELTTLRDSLFQRRAHVNPRTLKFLSRWLFDHMSGADRELLELTAQLDAARERPNGPARPVGR